MKAKFTVIVRGKEHEWGFDFWGDPIYFEDWKADNLEVIRITNTFPDWVMTCGLVGIWCWLQDHGFIPL